MPLEARERIPFLCMAIASASGASGALIARAAADTLFLDYYGADLLSVMYVGTGLFVGVLAYLFARRSRSVAFSRMLVLSCGVLAFSAVCLRVGLLFPWPGVRILAYFWADLSVASSMLLFWGFFGQVFNARQARRLLGWIGATGTLACILGGFLIKPFTGLFGTANLLVVVALLFVVFGAATTYLARKYSFQSAGLRETPRSEENLPDLTYYFRLLTRPRVRIFSLQAVLGTVVVVLVDFQFKVVSQSYYQGAALATFFGKFYGIANVVVLAIQLLTLHRLLQGKGLLTSLRVLPACLLVGSTAMLFRATFWAVVGTKLIVQTTLFTVDSAANQILYLGFKYQIRNQVRALVDGMCRPFAVGATGAALALISGAVSVRVLALPALLLCLLWLHLARRNYAGYVDGLVENLHARRPDSSGPTLRLEPKAVENYTHQALLDARVEGLPQLVGALHELEDVDWTPQMRILLGRPEPQIKVAALDYLSKAGKIEELNQILEHFRHPDAQVRSAAVRAAAAGGDRVINPIREALRDPDPRVQAEAAAALLEMGHFYGLVEGAIAIREMLESTDEFHRAAVAGPLSRLPLQGRTHFMLQLLRDSEPVVRSAVLKACGNAPAPELVPLALSQLSDVNTADAATEALTGLGPLTVDYLCEIASREELVAIFGRSDRLAHVLAEIGSPQALQVLQSVLDATASHAPSAVIQAYCRILQRQHHFAPHQKHWEAVVRCQIEAARHWQRMLARTASLSDGTLLLRALREEYEKHVDHLFLLIGCRAAGIRMEAVRAELNSDHEEERVRALEFVEHMLPANLSAEIMCLSDDRRGKSMEPAAPAALMEILDSASSEPMILGGIYAVLQSGCRGALPLVRKYLSHESAVVRETAQYTLARMEAPEDAGAQGSASSQDPQKASCLKPPSTGKTGGLEGGPNMIVVEKMLFLWNVPLFSNLATHELVRIASIAREVSYPSDSPIIREGEYGDNMFLIVDGEVLIHRGQTSIKILGPKEFFGEMSMIDGAPRSASATAVSDCLLLRIDQGEFLELLATHNSVALSLIRVLVQRLRELLPISERVEKGV